jgi:fibronectin type 3 domain-containing protein
LVGSNRFLYAIYTNGSLKWKFGAEGHIDSSPAIGSDGTIYFGSNDNYLYAINLRSPFSPKDLQTTYGNNYVNLSWQEPEYDGGSEIYGYKIYKGQEPGKEEYLKIINTTSLSFTDNDVVNGETYYYYVTAINEVGESKYSNDVNATPLGPPTQPIDLVASINEGKIELNWNIPENDGGTDIERYNIYRGPNLENATFHSYVHPPTTTYQDPTAKEKSMYFYYVTALNSIAEGESSNNVTITLVIYPSPPMDLKVTAGDSNVILQWEAPVEDGGSKIIKYHILRRPVDGRGKLIQSVDESITSYQDAAVVNGKTYIYYVTAENSLGESDPSQEVTAKPVKSRDQEDEIMVSFEINIFILIIIVIIVIVAILLFFKKRKAKKRDHKSFFEDPKTPDSQYPDEPQPPSQYPPQYPPQQPPQYPPKEYY